MASTSFSLPNNLFARQFASARQPHSSSTLPSSLRVSAGSYATAERIETASHTVSFYDVLGIQVGASCQEVKSAYRRLARALHPDVAPKCRSGATAEEFMRVHAAYATLSDPEKRALYENSLFRRRPWPAATSATGYPPMAPHRRSWETDQCW